MAAATFPTMSLNDGASLPVLGFGTYALNGAEAIRSVGNAFSSGYRLIDTAVNYANEDEVGQAVATSDSSGLVVTTKVPGRDHGYEETMRSFESSKKRLGRVDLYLIHWPNPSRGTVYRHLARDGRPAEAWATSDRSGSRTSPNNTCMTLPMRPG